MCCHEQPPHRWATGTCFLPDPRPRNDLPTHVVLLAKEGEFHYIARYSAWDEDCHAFFGAGQYSAHALSSVVQTGDLGTVDGPAGL